LNAPIAGQRRSRQARLLRALKLLVVALVAWFIASTVVQAWDQLSAAQWQFHPVWLLLAGTLYLAGLLPCAWFWRRTLVVLGQQPSWGQTLRAYFIGHLGKYVPGKAMVIVLRAAMLRGPGTNTAMAAASVFYETLTMMGVGAMVAAVLLATWFSGQRLMILLALGLAAVAIVPTLPGTFPRLARLAGMGWASNKPDVAAKEALALARFQRLGYGWLAAGWLAMAAGWLVMGLSFWATLRSTGILTTDGQPPHVLWHLPLCTAAVSLATVAGFLSLIPGGALVREGVLIALMPQAGFSSADAVVAAVFLRLVWLAAELAACSVACLGHRRTAPS
jgi:uncharacterized membrane protein YbhN (UPF0104 family)